MSKKEFSTPTHIQEALVDRVRRNAKVKNHETGYVDAGFLNKPDLISSLTLRDQAHVIAHYLRHVEPTHIIGIPMSGIPLAATVAEQLKAQFVPTVKTNNGDIHPLYQTYLKPYGSQWRNKIDLSAYSFTREETMEMEIMAIEPGAKYVIIDDVVARGHVGLAVINTIRNHGGVVVGFGTGFDKAFQGGVQRILQEAQIPIISVVTIKNMNLDNTVEAQAYPLLMP